MSHQARRGAPRRQRRKRPCHLSLILQLPLPLYLTRFQRWKENNHPVMANGFARWPRVSSQGAAAGRLSITRDVRAEREAGPSLRASSTEGSLVNLPLESGGQVLIKLVRKSCRNLFVPESPFLCQLYLPIRTSSLGPLLTSHGF